MVHSCWGFYFDKQACEAKIGLNMTKSTLFVNLLFVVSKLCPAHESPTQYSSPSCHAETINIWFKWNEDWIYAVTYMAMINLDLFFLLKCW